MALPKILDRLVFSPEKSRSTRKRRILSDAKRCPSHRRRRAILESLEDRRVLAAFAVTTLADTGAGSLRSAIESANANAGPDTIDFNTNLSGTINLSAASGSLVITGPVDITGPGASAVTVSATTNLVDKFRVFEIADTSGDVSIAGLTLTGGSLDDKAGGGILFQSDGVLTIQDSVITGNRASNGGGISSENAGSLQISNSTISDNTAAFGPGGGIHNVDGDTTLSATVVDNNQSYNSGAGLFSPYLGTVTITDSQITNNRITEDGYNGAGVYVGSGNVTISGSTISGNVTPSDGAGVYSLTGDLTITRTTISGNEAGYGGGGIFNESGLVSLTSTTVNDNSAMYGDGGGINNNSGTVTLSKSTVSGNFASENGGGIANNSGQINVVQSVIHNNTADGSGGGVATVTGGVTLTNATVSTNAAGVSGGGLQSKDGPLRLVNATLTLNTAVLEGGGIGVINDDAGESVLIHNSIVAANTSPAGPDFLAPGNPGANLDVAFSLIGNNSDTTLAATQGIVNGNFIGSSNNAINPQLGPLAENGGPTLTHEVGFGSNAVDSGSNSLAMDFGIDGAPGGGDDSLLTSDQRAGLYARVATTFSFNIDMGAIELQQRPVFTVDTTDDVVNGNYSLGDRSLREFIELANESSGLDAILFAPSLPPTITLDPALGSLVISDDLNIFGPGADTLTIQNTSGQQFRLLDITSTAGDVTLIGLSFTGGDAGNENGGAIRFQSSGDLVVTHSAFAGNSAASGGAVSTDAGTLSIASSTLSQNSATQDGGAIAVTGATSSLYLLNSTLSENAATASGGGIYSENTDVEVTSSTITLNVAAVGGGIGMLANGNGESLDVNNSIIAENTAGAAADFIAPSNTASDLDVDFSLIGDNNGTSLTESSLNAGVPVPDASGNLIGGGSNPVIDALLGPLADNGGSTPTHSPLDGSLAIDAGSLALLPQDTLDVDLDNNRTEFLPVDQRGANRVVGNVEIGAVELAPLAVITWSDPAGITFGTTLSSTQLNATSSTPGTYQYTPSFGTVLDAGDGQVLTVNFTPANPLLFRAGTANVSIDVAQAVPTITWADPSDITFGTLLSNTQLNASANVTGSFVYDPAIDALLDAGTQTLSVTFTPNDATNYAQAIATANLTVSKADPVLTWNDPSEIVFGTSLSATQLNATADVAGTFVYDPITGTTLNAGVDQVLGVTFTPDDDNYNSVATTVMIDVTKADPVITWANPDNIDAGTALDSTQLDATADVPGVFAYNPSAGTILSPGVGQPLSVAFTPTDADNYNIVNATVFINVSQTLDFGDAPTQYPVLLADDGARHVTGSLTLGAFADTETDGQPSAAADGDGSDEDGVVVIASAVASGSDTTSSFSVVASEAARLDAWVDFNGDGDWNDTGEQIATNLALSAGANTLSYTVPSGSSAGQTAARFRISTTGSLAPTGEASDGEVEDYIVTLLDGGALPDANVDLILNTATVSVSGSTVVVTDGQNDLFAASSDTIGQLRVQAGDTDDQITLNLNSGPDGGLNLDGGAGSNSLELTGSSLDLTGVGLVTAANFQSIELTGSGSNTVTIDGPTVAALSPGNFTVAIAGGVGDAVEFDDAADWRLVDPIIVNSTFIRVAMNQVTSEIVELEFPSPWKNLIEPSDVDNSGVVTAGDALQIINELSRRAFSNGTTQAMNDPLLVNPWPGVYYDQNGDGNATALDALRVINQLALIPSNEGELITNIVPLAAQRVVRSDGRDVDKDDAISEERNDGKGSVGSTGKLVNASNAASTDLPGDDGITESSREPINWSARVDELLSEEVSMEFLR